MEDHWEHIKIIVEILTKHHLKLNFAKCLIARTSIELLGFIVDEHGTAILPNRLPVVSDWPLPMTGKEMQSFLGFTNYLRDYIPFYAELSAPLQKHSSAKQISWTKELEDQFASFKDTIANAVVLSFPNDDLPFHVATDASNNAIGALLYQVQSDNTIKYIRCASRLLSTSECNYSATKRELLGIVYGLQQFNHWVAGRHFYLHTDHQALTYMWTQKHPNRMMIEWLEFLQSFTCTIMYVPGISNGFPDALSRVVVAAAKRSADTELNAGEFIAKRTRSAHHRAMQNLSSKSPTDTASSSILPAATPACATTDSISSFDNHGIKPAAENASDTTFESQDSSSNSNTHQKSTTDDISPALLNVLASQNITSDTSDVTDPSKDIPDNSLAVGNPAKVIRKLNE